MTANLIMKESSKKQNRLQNYRATVGPAIKLCSLSL